MSAWSRLAVLCASLLPLHAVAQYDYNSDLVAAGAIGYPPLISLLITKGGRVNAQDGAGRTSLMMAIRNGHREAAALMLKYKPDTALLDVNNHSAAIEAALADEPRLIKAVLRKDDLLQVSQALLVARKAGNQRVFNRIAEVISPIDADELIAAFISNPLQVFGAGNAVSYRFSPAEDSRDVCANRGSTLLLQGVICKVEGESVSVVWNKLANLNNENPQCGNRKYLSWDRRPGVEPWNAKFLGACGAAPGYFPTVPSVFPYRTFLVPELSR